MQTIEVGENEHNQRLDRVLGHYFYDSPKSFIYKMLRKKNITLNDKKALGNEKLEKGDVIKLWFSEESLEKLTKKPVLDGHKQEEKRKHAYDFASMIIYEDTDILVVHKPPGLLSQKVSPSDISVNDLLIAYLLESGQMHAQSLQTFKPSICNRLDRNTEGLLLCGKTLVGLRNLNQMIATRTIKKYYLAVVSGRLETSKTIDAWLYKDEKKNTVIVKPYAFSGAYPIKTSFFVVRKKEELSLLEVELMTGKTHQIRAYLASIGLPVIGDYKYGNRIVNERYGIRTQLLLSYRLVFPDGRIIQAKIPQIFKELVGE